MKKLNRSSRKAVSSALASIHRSRRARLWSVLPEVLEERQLLSTYLLTTSADSGAGSLRQAILNVDADSSADTIQFAMTDGSAISLSSALPAITNTVTIDAQGQVVELTGASAGAAANGLDFESGSAGSLVNGLTIDSFGGAGVVLNAGSVTLQNNYIGTNTTGSAAKANHDGVLITSNANNLIGNVISGNNYSGVSVTGDGNVLQGNLIGTDATGTQAVANSGGGSSTTTAGVFVFNASNTLIGGPTAADRNVISGNSQSGITFVGGTGAGNVVQGNYIGLDKTGAVALGNSYAGVTLGTYLDTPVSNVSVLGNVISANVYSGILLYGATNNTIQGNLIGTDATGHGTMDSTTLLPTFGNNADGITIDQDSAGNLIGGTTSAARNVISGNWGNGVGVVGAASGTNLVEGNYIGVDIDGKTAPAGNQGQGVYVQAGQLTLGAVGAANVISGNLGYGVWLSGGTSQVIGNLIGVAADGVSALGNAGDGVYITNSSGNVIGGTAAGQGNVIAHNGAGGTGRGVNIMSGVNNAVEGNAIYANATLGIDLGGDGVTKNDASGHTGANNFQDFPVLVSITGDGTNAKVAGTMTGVAGNTYTIDFYDNATADPSGYGQGQVYVGSIQVTIGSGGTANFSATFAQPVASGAALTQWSVTATDASGNTSEFSADATETIHVLQPTTTTLASSANPSSYGQAVMFSATVSGNGGVPTGMVQFSIDGVAVGAPVAVDANGMASYSASGLSVAGHSVTASYSGDGNFLSSGAALTQTVNQDASSTALSSSNLSPTYGQTVTLTATVAASVNGVMPTGTVTFMDGSTPLGTVPLSNGMASLSLSTLAAGGHTITAVYSGDANVAGSTSNPVVENVASATPPPTGSISGYVFCDDNLNGVFDATTQDGVVSPESGEAGATVTLTGTTAGGASVSLTATTDANGYYTFGGLAAGTYNVSLTGYSPDHQAEQSHGTVKISYGTTVNLTAGQALAGAAEGAATANNGLDFAEIAPGGLQGFVWADTNNDGNVDFNEAGIVNVTVQLNGVTYTGAKVSQTTVTDNSGEYLFTNLQPGSYTLTEVTPNGFTDGKDSVGSLGGSETYSSNCGSSSGCSTGQSCYNDCYGSYGYNCFTHYSNNCYSNGFTNCGSSNNCGNCGGSSNYCNSQSNCGGNSNCGWSSGCNSAQNTFSNVQIGGCEDVGVGYNFGNKTPSLNTGGGGGGCCGGTCHSTNTASLAFWHNSYGQALLCSLNGGQNSTALGNWLATMFPKMYGSQAKVNFAGMTNVQIAAFYNANDFNVSGIKLDAAVLSSALSCYVTNSTWAGGNYATRYGFAVSAQGVGYDTVNVGSNGAAFGVANNSNITILQALDATDQQSNDGLLYNGNTTLRAQAYNVYAAIAQNGLTS
jgi:parallel beta-helix repeat protein